MGSALSDVEKIRDGWVGYFKKALLNNQINVSCPADKTIQIFSLHIEIYINAMDRLIT